MSSRPAVLIPHPVMSAIAAALEPEFEVVRGWDAPSPAALARVFAVVVLGEDRLDLVGLDALPALRHVACFTSGYDGINVQSCLARGWRVTHAPGVNHEDVADHALGLILAARRRLVEGDRRVCSGEWVSESRLFTPSMRGCRVGIVGMGAIGEALAARVAAMGCVTTWWGPRPKPTLSWPRADTLIDLARGSDVMVVACRADETNRGLISAEVVQALGPNGLLVNVARGSLVDEDALIQALRAGRLGGAALDVFETEPTPSTRWADVPNVVLTPHSAGSTMEAVQGMLALLIRNLRAAAAGEPPITPVP